MPLLDKRKYSIRQQGECTSLVTFLTTLKQLQEKRTAFENHLSHFFTEKPTASSIDIVSTFINCNDELFQPYETLHRKTVLARKSPTETLLTALLFPELTFTNTKDVNVIFNNSNVTQPVNIAQEDTPSLERIAQVFRTLNKVLEAKGTLKAAVIASDTQRIETAYANLWEANAELKKAELFAFSQSSVLLSTRLQRSLCAALPERIKDVKTIEVYERL